VEPDSIIDLPPVIQRWVQTYSALVAGPEGS
jgi:hypothetical protein